MSVSTNSYEDSRFSTWLLSITLLLSLSVFSGYAGKTTARYLQPVQTGWNYINNYKKPPRTVSYKKATAVVYVTNAVNKKAAYKAALSAYSNLIQLQLTAARRVFNEISFVHRFTSVQLIPGNSAEDNPPSMAV